MAVITIYSTHICPYCVMAKRLLDRKSVGYEEVFVDDDPAARIEMQQRSGRRTVPQIWIDEQHIGGCDELYALERAGTLDKLLRQSSDGAKQTQQ